MILGKYIYGTEFQSNKESFHLTYPELGLCSGRSKLCSQKVIEFLGKWIISEASRNLC